MAQQEFGFPRDKYPELMLLCGHDTNHDFFEKLEPIKQLWGQGGGAGQSGISGEEAYMEAEGTGDPCNNIMDLDYDSVIQLIDEDYNIYTAISENNAENNPHKTPPGFSEFPTPFHENSQSKSKSKSKSKS